MSESDYLTMALRSFKGIILPIVIPYFVYKICKNQINHRLISSNSLQSKVVLITGASSGVGEALAKVLYESGCRLILSARRMDQLERVKNELISHKSLSVECFEPKLLRLDLSEIDEMKDFVDKSIELYGKIDIVINNAGISCRGTALETSVQVDQKIMTVNYFGTVSLTKAILPSMVERNSGKIVVISSIQGRIAIPYRSAYSASKHAIQAFFDALRAELFNTNISICVISPGYVKTNLSLNALTGEGSKYGIMDETTSSGMSPEEVAQSVKLSLIRNDKELLISSLIPKIAILIRALFPSLYFYIMNKRAKKLKN